jgi:hypothetical protein
MQNDSSFDLDSILKKHQGITSAHGFSPTSSNATGKATRKHYKSLLDELSADLEAFDASTGSEQKDLSETSNAQTAPLHTPEATQIPQPKASPPKGMPPQSTRHDAPTASQIVEETSSQSASRTQDASREVAQEPIQTYPQAPLEVAKDSDTISSTVVTKQLKKWKRITIVLVVVIALLSLVSIALATDKFLHKSEPTAKAEQSATNRGPSDPKVSKASPFYFAGGQGYAIIFKDKIEISSLKFKSNLDGGIFELRATPITHPLGGTVLFEGEFADVNEINFETTSTSALVIVYKDLPQGVKSVHIADITVE